jgi:hypothetical protein
VVIRTREIRSAADWTRRPNNEGRPCRERWEGPSGEVAEAAAQAAGADGESQVVIVQKKAEAESLKKYLRKCDQLHIIYLASESIYSSVKQM